MLRTLLKHIYFALCLALALNEGANAAPISFRNQVEPILTRWGCNQGACHGSQFGKGGFKLSLAGYDPDFDYQNIVQLSRGRRINFAQPAKSLLLTKPTLNLPHQGGLRLKQGSADYQTVLAWVRQGASPPNPNDPVVTRLRVVPENAFLRVGDKIRLRAYAQFSDGSEREVTPHTRIVSQNEEAVSASPQGEAVAKGRGDAAIMLRYGGYAAVSRLSIPYNVPPNFAWKPQNYVDTHLAKRWREMGLTPSPLASEAEFLRRVFLDLIGTLPTPQEATTFLADPAPDKRRKLIDRLLERPEYVDYWTLKWSDLFRANRATLGTKSAFALNRWLRRSLSENRPYNVMVQELLTAQGGSHREGTVNYFRAATTPQELTEATTQLFLGIRLQCAKCHQHPFEKWSQKDYYQFAAFFARVGFKEGGSLDTDQSLRLATEGEVLHPKTKAIMMPTPLALEVAPKLAVPENPAEDRRVSLAKWLTHPQNTLFAKMLVNRYWGALMGRGIVHPVDDMRVTNPPSHPQLLEALAQDFTRNRYDLKHLLRTLCNSRAYQLSSRPNAQNSDDDRLYSHYLPKRMSAETLLDALCQATAVPERFLGLPLGTRALELPDPKVASPFLDTFGRSPRSTVCECERVSETDLPQTLQMLNGDTVQNKIASPNGRVAQLLKSGKSDRDIVTELYLATLSRPPRPAELRLAQALLARSRDRTRAMEDLLWALLNVQDFNQIR